MSKIANKKVRQKDPRRYEGLEAFLIGFIIGLFKPAKKRYW